MQESGTPELQVSAEVGLLMTSAGTHKGGKQHGDGEQRGKRPLDNKELGKEDKTKVRKFREPEDEKVDGEEVEFEGEMLTEAKYFTKRIFVFVHHFAGKTDNLSKALEEEARAQGLRVSTISVEKENGQNLASREPYVHHLVSAKRGDIDGYHSGFPCNTYPRLRFRAQEGMPKPLRTKSHPYGIPGLDQRRKAEVDEGTILMSRSVDIIKAMKESDRNLAVPSFYTLENPPESNVEEHISAWEMPELKSTVDGTPEFRKVLFNTCIYQQDQPQEARMKKPQCFGGNLPNLMSLGGFCKCPLDASHLAVVGPTRSRASGEYPKKLCEAYAKVAVQHFVRMGRAEFLEAKRMGLQKNINEMKAKAEKHREELGKMAPTTPTKRTQCTEPPGAPSKKRPTPAEQDQTDPGGGAASSSTPTTTWTEGRGKYGMVREGKPNNEIPKNAMYVGGMRNPAKSVRGLPTLENLGKRVNASWQAFIKRHPEALNLAESYGTKDVQVNDYIKERWKEAPTLLRSTQTCWRPG